MITEPLKIYLDTGSGLEYRFTVHRSPHTVESLIETLRLKHNATAVQVKEI